MGYTNYAIANVTEPKRLSISAVPNFIVIERNGTGTRQKYKISITVKNNLFNTSAFLLRIAKPSGEVVDFEGTTITANVGGRVFKLESIPLWLNAQNLQNALLTDAYLRANFDITVPFVYSGGVFQNGDTIVIESKGYGTDYQIAVTTPNDTTNFAYQISVFNDITTNNDSISGNRSTAQIDADIYLQPAVPMGFNDTPDVPARIGTYALTLGKTYYSGEKLWFDVNNVFSNYLNFNRPPDPGSLILSGWFDTGTLSRYRATLRVLANGNNIPFFTTNTFYVLNGYSRAFENINMEDYIYEFPKTQFKLLTNRPEMTYVQGQREFLNFVFADPYRGGLVGPPLNKSFSVAIMYKAFTASGEYIGVMTGEENYMLNLYEVNTRELEIADLLAIYPDTGKIEVSLAMAMEDVNIFTSISNVIKYIVRPENISKENTFIFLNSLGGWDSYNADADTTDAFKADRGTYIKSVTPDSKKGDSIETIYTANLEEEYTVEGAPLKDAAAEWLKELSVSKAVYYKGRYIIITDFSAPRNGTNFYRPIIKFKYSETYTNS